MSLEGIGAFLSGVGSVIGAAFAFRIFYRRLKKDCEERVALLREGIKIGRHEE